MSDRFLTIEETAALLKVTPRTVRSWIAAGKLRKAALPGRAVRIPASEIDRLELGEVETPLERSPEP
jgi:excisionase family DNA binding protein